MGLGLRKKKNNQESEEDVLGFNVNIQISCTRNREEIKRNLVTNLTVKREKNWDQRRESTVKQKQNQT